MFQIKLAGNFARSVRSAALAAACLILAGGCSTDNAGKMAGPGNGTVPMTLKAMGLGTASGRQPATMARTLGASFATSSDDTLPVTFTKALIVVHDVRFRLISAAETDTTGGGTDSTGAGEGDADARDQAYAMAVEGHGMGHGDGGHGDGDHGRGDDSLIVFTGPFVVDLLTQTSDSLDTQMVEPGDYRNIVGHIRPLLATDWNASSFEYLIGGTVYLQGTVDGPGGDTFTYRTKFYHVFRIPGKFTVDASTPATAFLTFDISSWLRGPGGRFLDPRDGENGLPIRNAIIRSLRMGMDRNHNGHCDDDMHGEDN